MRAWYFAALLGAIGAGLGAIAASGAGLSSAQPLWILNGGAWFAILGAILGGILDIVQVITETAGRHRPTDEPDRRKSDP